MTDTRTPTHCLVTGGAGFIGSHIAECLLRSGHAATVVDDLSSGRPENLEHARAAADEESGAVFRFVEGSVLDDDVLNDALAGVDVVFHQAAIPSVPRSFADPGATLRANVEGTGRLLEGCRRHEIGRFVMASSSSVYGDTPTLPKVEDMPPSPLSPYALSKLAGEHLCDIYARQSGIATRCLRYFNVFGPRQDPTSQYAAVIPNFITSMLSGEAPTIYGDGLQSRDFTFVDNVVAANFLAAGLDVPASLAGAPLVAAPTGEAPENIIVNVGAGERRTIQQLVEALNVILDTAIVPQLVEPRPGDVLHSHAAVDRAVERLGWRPLVGFTEGLERTVAWFRKSATETAVVGQPHA